MVYYCFNITSFCNMNCPFCYRIGDTLGSVDIKQAYRYIDCLVLRGCTNINITGGEPLLHPHWREIVYYCHAKGLYVAFTTNGLLLDIEDEAIKYIDRLCIPLDSINGHMKSTQLRSAEQVNKALSIINLYRMTSYSFKLKINTVITSFNYGVLDCIFEAVNYQGIDWKLFDYRTKGKYNRLQNTGRLPEQVVINIIKKYIGKNSKCSIKYSGSVIPGYNEKHDKNPLILNYNGDLYSTGKDDDILLENITCYT